MSSFPQGARASPRLPVWAPQPASRPLPVTPEPRDTPGCPGLCLPNPPPCSIRLSDGTSSPASPGEVCRGLEAGGPHTGSPTLRHPRLFATGLRMQTGWNVGSVLCMTTFPGLSTPICRRGVADWCGGEGSSPSEQSVSTPLMSSAFTCRLLSPSLWSGPYCRQDGESRSHPPARPQAAIWVAGPDSVSCGCLGRGGGPGAQAGEDCAPPQAGPWVLNRLRARSQSFTLLGRKQMGLSALLMPSLPKTSQACPGTGERLLRAAGGTPGWHLLGPHDAD